MPHDTLDPTVLRRVLMEQPEALATRVVAIGLGVAIAAAVLHLVRSGRLREEFSPVWLAAAGAILTLSVWFGALRWLTAAIGAWTPSSTLFFFGEMFLLAICLNYAVRLSQLSNQVKMLAQELAILRSDLARGAAPDEPLRSE